MTDSSNITTPNIDRPPLGWFVLDVMPKNADGLDWVALMVDVDPEKIKRPRRECWVRIPGKHRNLEDALDAFEDMLATRH